MCLGLGVGIQCVWPLGQQLFLWAPCPGQCQCPDSPCPCWLWVTATTLLPVVCLAAPRGGHLSLVSFTRAQAEGLGNEQVGCRRPRGRVRPRGRGEAVCVSSGQSYPRTGAPGSASKAAGRGTKSGKGLLRVSLRLVISLLAQPGDAQAGDQLANYRCRTDVSSVSRLDLCVCAWGGCT